jgi:ribosomal protein L31
MKDGIHPNYRDVCFQDLSNGFKFVTRSCVSRPRRRSRWKTAVNCR